MPPGVQGLLSVLGRVLLSAIFFMSVVGQKIPKFNDTVGEMAKHKVPAPQVLLVGAIVFLLAGTASVVLGYRARIGALLLLVFLVLASYYFHNFWDYTDPTARQGQMIHFMKNLSMAGAMIFIIANGSGAWSLDRRRT
jgi:putative oxidoreductase